MDEPDVYIEVLKQLHDLYFEQTKEYLTAFIISQEIVKAKRQAGQFAFIGTSQIALPITISENQETIAPEIVASGRENDVKNLVERVIINDYKVIVIYGESGVGKSSLVNGGLIPCLRAKILAEGRIYPLYIRVYSNWIDELLANIDRRMGNTQLTQEDDNSRVGNAHLTQKDDNSRVGNTHQTDEREHNNTEERLLNQLQELVKQKLRIVFIFDQFEEFFFVQTTTHQQHLFFQFLGKCLDLQNLKIVFSLRKDYVHFLLDIPGMERISNDILGKEVLYKIGDFTPQETKNIINNLRKN